MSRFTSRKFMAFVTAIVTSLLGATSGAISPADAVTNVLIAAIGYITVEGYVDAKRAAAIARAAAKTLDEAAAVIDRASS